VDSPDRRSLGFDFNAAMAAKVHDCLDLALALSGGVDHLLEDFVSLQEMLVLLVPDEDFNRVFQSARLTDLRVLLASIAGRIELVTDSPGLQMTAAEVRELRERIASGGRAYGDDDHDGDPPSPPTPDPEQSPPNLVTLREKVARARESADRSSRPEP
jgi:hypothetical protein